MVCCIGASLAWLIVSVAAWYLRRKMRSVRRGTDLGKKRAAPQCRKAATVDDRTSISRLPTKLPNGSTTLVVGCFVTIA
jgi:hypothetical protein